MNNITISEISRLQIEILKEAIKDTQGIINSADIKARFILAINLAILIIIMTSLFHLKNIIENLPSNINCEVLVLVISTILLALFTLIYNIYLISKTLKNVIFPRISPLNYIKNFPKNLEKSIFFPLPEKNGYLNFENYSKLLKNLDSDKQIQDLLLLELLKVSYIRDIKLKKLQNIILKFGQMSIILAFYIMLYLILLTLYLIK